MDDIIFILEENEDCEEFPHDDLDIYAVMSVDLDGRYSIIQILNEPMTEVISDVKDILPDYDAEEPPGVYVMKLTPVYDCPQSMFDPPEYDIEIDFQTIENLNNFIFEEEENYG